MPVFRRSSLRLGDVATLRALDLAEVLRERHLLVVGDVLVMEDQHRVAVHAGLDRRHFRACSAAFADRRRDTSPANTGWIWRIETMGAPPSFFSQPRL